MDNSLKTGAIFGLTSGAITTLGLMIGLYSGTHSKTVVIAGILTIAFADAFSDALGIHISEEAKGDVSTKQVWAATIATWASKFIFTLTFLIPILIFSLNISIIICILWCVFILILLSYLIAKSQQKKASRVIFEHLAIAFVVIVITYFVGSMISKYIA